MCMSCSTGLTLATASLAAGVGASLIVLLAPARGDGRLGGRLITALASGAMVFVASFIATSMALSCGGPILAAQAWPQFAHIDRVEGIVRLLMVCAMIVATVVVCWLARGRGRHGAGASRGTRRLVVVCAGAVGLGAGLYAVDRSELDWTRLAVDLTTLDWTRARTEGDGEWAIVYRTRAGGLAAVDDRGVDLDLPSVPAIERLYVRVGEPRGNDFVRADMARTEPFDWKTHFDDRLSPIPGHGGFSTNSSTERVGLTAFSSGLLWRVWYPHGRFEPRDRWSLGVDAICMQYGDEMIVVYGLDPVEVRAVVRGAGPIPVPLVRYRATLNVGLSSGDMPQDTTTTPTTTPPH